MILTNKEYRAMLRFVAIFWGLVSLLYIAIGHSHAAPFTPTPYYGSNSTVYFCKVSQDAPKTDTVLKDYPMCIIQHRKPLPNWGANGQTLSYGLKHL